MSRDRLAALVALLPEAAGLALPPAEARLGFGVEDVDARLGGGLAVAALHELYAESEGDGPAAAAVALLLALRNGRAGPIVWVGEARARQNGRLYGLGLVELGVDPARLLLVEAPDTLAMLRAGADAVACSGVAALILAPHGKAAAVDLTATRRLALAAARSGVTVLLLRQGDVVPSAAHSRWQVAAAASTRLAADAPGLPAFALTLLRHRSGVTGFSTILEWNRDRTAFGTATAGGASAVAFKPAGAASVQRARAA
jgi:protein ImuA